jgi:nicotinate phosphoribosyltransferase
MSSLKLDYWIIESLLDTDLYKITMLQAFYHAPEFRTVDIEWKFACRNLHSFDLAALIPEINRQLEHVCTLYFADEELQYLAGFPFISRDFIEFLRIYRLDSRFVTLKPKGKDLDLRIRGPLIHVALFEIYLLAIISELHTFAHFEVFSPEIARERLQKKIDTLDDAQGEMTDFVFVDFGTRRRASRNQQPVLH